MSTRQFTPILRAIARSSSQQSIKRSYSLTATSTRSLVQPILKSGLNQVQTRGIKTLDFAGTKEVVYERADWPVSKLQEYFKVSSTLSFLLSIIIPWLFLLYLCCGL